MTTQINKHETGFQYTDEAAENTRFDLGYALAAEAVAAEDAKEETNSVDIELVSTLHYGKEDAEDYDMLMVQTPVTDYAPEALKAVVEENQDSFNAALPIKEQTTDAQRTLVEQGFAHFKGDEVLEPTFKEALEHLTAAAKKAASE